MTRLMADGASGALSWWSAGMILDGEITHFLLVMRCSVDAEKLLEANKILIVPVSLMLTLLMMRLILSLTPMVPWGTMKLMKSHTGAETLQKVAIRIFCQMSWMKRLKNILETGYCVCRIM